MISNFGLSLPWHSHICKLAPFLRSFPATRSHPALSDPSLQGAFMSKHILSCSLATFAAPNPNTVAATNNFMLLSYAKVVHYALSDPSLQGAFMSKHILSRSLATFAAPNPNTVAATNNFMLLSYAKVVHYPKNHLSPLL